MRQATVQLRQNRGAVHNRATSENRHRFASHSFFLRYSGKHRHHVMIVHKATGSWRGRLVSMFVVATVCGLPVAVSATMQDAIRVEGNRRIDADTVRSYFHADNAGRYDAAALDEALKEMTATGQFDDVRIERAGEHIIVHVMESKVLDRVAFEGNKKVKDADLTAVVQSKPRGGLARATVQGDVNRIIEAYHRAGREGVRVTPQVIDRGNDRVDLVYT